MAVSPDPNLVRFFAKMENQIGVIVREAPHFDLDGYVQNYEGQNRVDRLLHIGRCSVVLCVDALKAAVVAAKGGKDQQRYRDAVECLQLAAPTDPDAKLDSTWLDTVGRDNRNNVHRLDSELKGYKNNLVKESVRLTQEELAKQYAAMGKLEDAFDMFTRMRGEATTPKHVVDTGKQLINVGIQRRDWVTVASNVSKITGLQGEEDEKASQPYLKTIAGLALLGQEKYLDAAQCFLDADYRGDQSLEHLSLNDVAVYGGLLALATMTRVQLRDKVLENANFRNFLELEPHIRRAINQFVNGRYSACIQTLEAYRADYLLDIYLQKHIPSIYGNIRQKCIVQYLLPFSCVTLKNMSESFAVDGASIENELVDMIREGVLIDTRVDTIDQVILKNVMFPRRAMQTAGLEMATSYEKELAERIRRMSIAAASLEVKGTGRGKNSELDGPFVTNEWFDSAQIEE